MSIKTKVESDCKVVMMRDMEYGKLYMLEGSGCPVVRLSKDIVIDLGDIGMEDSYWDLTDKDNQLVVSLGVGAKVVLTQGED